MNLQIAVQLTPPLVVRFEGLPPHVAQFLLGEYGRLRSPECEDGQADFVFRFLDSIHRSADWESLTPHTMLCGDSFILLDKSGRARITFSESGPEAADIEHDASLDFVRFRVIDPVVTALALQRDGMVVHGSATCSPQGGVLLLGRPGCGKTRTMLELVAAGHGYVGDDRLLLAHGCRLLPLQGLLGLKMSALQEHPALMRTASPEGYRAARTGRRALRTAQMALRAIPGNVARQAAEGFRRVEADIDRHVFLVDPKRTLPGSTFHDQVDVAVAYLLSCGSPELVEKAPRPVLENWLLDAAAHEHEALIGLLRPAALVRPRWRARLDEVVTRLREVADGASGKFPALRVRTPPGAATGAATLQIPSAPADTSGEKPLS